MINSISSVKAMSAKSWLVAESWYSPAPNLPPFSRMKTRSDTIPLQIMLGKIARKSFTDCKPLLDIMRLLSRKKIQTFNFKVPKAPEECLKESPELCLSHHSLTYATQNTTRSCCCVAPFAFEFYIVPFPPPSEWSLFTVPRSPHRKFHCAFRHLRISSGL